MMRVALSFVVVLIAAPAFAQPDSCGGVQNGRIYGCLDTVNGFPVVNDATLEVFTNQPVVIQGWALSCVTAQQPGALTIGIGGEGLPVTPAAGLLYEWFPRLQRPDVSAVFRSCGTVKDFWGYAIVIPPYALQEGQNVLTLTFADPTIDPSLLVQRITLSVNRAPCSAFFCP